MTIRAKEEWLRSDDVVAPGPHPACSNDLVHVHYTFDFAQQITLPCQLRQVGPLYFKAPYRVQLFGVSSNEATLSHTTYMLGEENTIKVNGSKTHGLKTGISCLDQFFCKPW